MLKRQKIVITGRVQGVGFRPAVYRIAQSLGLSGFVYNDTKGVTIELQGQEEKIAEFLVRLQSNDKPPLAEIKSCKTVDIPIIRNEHRFVIETSDAQGSALSQVTADIATCRDCLAELADKQDFRYGYPFINCTNCGPRFTIIRNVPYDRPMTTMSEFDMCDDCRSEYENPANRRYHAQPISCFNCGPAYFLWERNNNKYTFSLRNHSATSVVEMQNNIKRVAQIISSGGIVAVHGIGGFHLICDASNDEAISRLRRWKYRPTKPFAVMAADIDIARKIAYIDDIEEQYLKSSSAPILLLKIRNNNIISELQILPMRS